MPEKIKEDIDTKSKGQIVFSPEIDNTNEVTYEIKRSRAGLIPISSIDLLDEVEMKDYLHRLLSISGTPEDFELNKIQKAHLTRNSKAGLEQVRLTHRALFKEIQLRNKTTLIAKPIRFFNSIRKVRQVYDYLRKLSQTKARKSEELNYKEIDLMLGSDWRVQDYDLPAIDALPTKDERDVFYNFDTLYRQVIINLADHVGLLPASESHHHNWPGGLLRHSLEVAEVAFKYSKTWDLPPIGLNDYEAKRKPRWQYAAWIIGLLHDIGKSITDMMVICEDAEGKTHRWNPMLSSLNKFCVDHKIVRYFVDMNDASRYMNSAGRFKRHEGVASALLDKMLTPEARHFLTSSPDPAYGLYEQISTILSGKHGDNYLMRALDEGERLSVHLSFKKIHSHFHFNNRNASVPEMLMRTLPSMVGSKTFMSHVFVVSGYVLLRYPEALHQLQQVVINKSPETKSILHYSPMEMAKQLRTSNYIKNVSNNNFLPQFAPTEAKIKNDTVSYERTSGFFAVIILEHPTMLFEQNAVPKSSTGVLRLSEDSALEFIGDDEVVEHTVETVVPENVNKDNSMSSDLDPDNKLKVIGRVTEKKAPEGSDNVLAGKNHEINKAELEFARRSGDAINSTEHAIERPMPDAAIKQADKKTDKKTKDRHAADVQIKIPVGNIDIFGLDGPVAVLEADREYDPIDVLKGVTSDSHSESNAPLATTNDNVDTIVDTVSDSDYMNNEAYQYAEMMVNDDDHHQDTSSDEIGNYINNGNDADQYAQMMANTDSQRDMPHQEATSDDVSDHIGDANESYQSTEISQPADALLPSKASGEGNDAPVVTNSIESTVIKFQEWVKINPSNKVALRSRTIPALVFNTPFFNTNGLEFNNNDWATTGDHVERKSEKSVKFKISFVEKVLGRDDAALSCEAKIENSLDNHDNNKALLQLLVSKLKGSEQLEAKFNSGRVPIPLYSSAINSINVRDADILATGLEIRRDTRFVYINTELLCLTGSNETLKPVINKNVLSENKIDKPKNKPEVKVVAKQISINVQMPKLSECTFTATQMDSKDKGAYMWLSNGVANNGIIKVSDNDLNKDGTVVLSKDTFTTCVLNALNNTNKTIIQSLSHDKLNLITNNLWLNIAKDKNAVQVKYIRSS